MSKFEVLSLLISVVAAIISAISLWRTRALAARQLELEEISAKLSAKQLARIEQEEKLQSKSKLDAAFVQTGNDYNLVITNVGGAEARDIHFGFDGKGYPFIESEIAETFPVSSLRPGKSIKVIAAFDMESGRRYRIDLHWKNPDGSEERDQIIATW